MDQHGQRRRLVDRSCTRRRLLHGALAAGGGALAASLIGARPAAVRRTRAASRQETTFNRAAAITSWGFGVEPTNPLAFARVEAFKKAYPSITLTIDPALDDAKLLAAIDANALPDLLWLDRFTTASWAARDILLPLTDFVARDAFDTRRFYAGALDEASYDGRLFGIPGGMDVRALYLNLDALAEVGADPATVDTGNWEQLGELATGLVKRDGEQVQRWGFDNKLQAGFIYLWGGANGGRFITDDATQTTFDDPKVVEALAWGVEDYAAQGGFNLFETFATTFQGDEQFARSLVAMTLYENWMLGIIARTVPDLNFAVLPMKQRGGQAPTSFTGGRAWYIPRQAKDPEAAWEFIKFMHTDDTWRIGANAVKQARREAGQPYIPSLTGSKTADQLQIFEVYEPIAPKFDQAVQLFPQLLEQSGNRPISRSPVGTQLHDVMTNQAVLPALRGEKAPQEALTQADQAAQAAIDAFAP